MTGSRFIAMVLVVCTAATAAAVMLGVMPALEARRAQREAGDAEAAVRASLDAAKADVASTSAELASVRAIIDQAGPGPKPIEQLNEEVGRLVELGRDAGLAVDRMDVGSARDGEFATEVPLTARCRGSAAAVGRWLESLHRDVPYVAVNSVRLTATGREDDGNSIVQLEASLVWRAAPGGGA
ncbi:MAG: GspMb/PilO family protein [Planctomycetota bacterium]